MSVSDSYQESINSSSSEEGEIWKLGSGKKKESFFKIVLILITTMNPYVVAL